jgi:HD-GYP domain
LTHRTKTLENAQRIEQEGRILAVSDVVEAMTFHRPYRPVLGIEKALTEISQNKTALYDSDVVNACTTLFEKKEFKLQ